MPGGGWGKGGAKKRRGQIIPGVHHTSRKGALGVVTCPYWEVVGQLDGMARPAEARVQGLGRLAGALLGTITLSGESRGRYCSLYRYVRAATSRRRARLGSQV